MKKAIYMIIILSLLYSICNVVTVYAEPSKAEPLYYALSKDSNSFICSTNHQEIKDICDKGWINKGILCYVSLSKLDGLVPLYRLRDSLGNYLYTVNETEKTSAIYSGYIDEGILCYVIPSGFNYNIPNISTYFRYYDSDRKLYRFSNEIYLPQNSTVFEGAAFSAWIAPVQIILPKPKAPTNLKVTADDDNIGLCWTKSNDAQEYEIHRSLDGISFAKIGVVSGAAYAYTDKYDKESKSSTYYYRIVSINPFGSSEPSNIVSVSMAIEKVGNKDFSSPIFPYREYVKPVIQLLPEKAPSDLKVAVNSSSSEVTLSWKDNSDNESDFIIYIFAKKTKEESTFSYNPIRVGADVTEVTLSSLPKDCTYTFKVGASKEPLIASYSGEVSIYLPVEPSGLTAKAISSTQINLKWKESSNMVEGLLLERKTQSSDYTVIAKLEPNTSSYNDEGLLPGTPYYYRLRATTFLCFSEYSNEVGIITPPSGVAIPEGGIHTPVDKPISTLKYPVTPSILTATASKYGVQIYWICDSDSETGFRIFRKKQDDAFVKIADIGSIPMTFIDNGITADGTYVYKLLAYNRTGNSDYSKELSVVYNSQQPNPITLQQQIPSKRVDTNHVIQKQEPTEINILTQTEIVFEIGKAQYQLNGKDTDMDAAPIIIENRTLLPIKYITDSIGAQLNWNKDEKKVTITLNGKTIELWIGKGVAKIDGLSKPIDSDNPKVAPSIVPPGRTMLPLRFIAENLGCKIDWNANQQQVTIIYNGI